MNSYYVFIVVFSSIFNGFINSELINTTEPISKGNETNQATVIFSTTINSNEISSTSTNAISEISTSIIDNNPPLRRSLKSHWWIFIIIIVTILVAISIGIIHYYRRKSPYRRFLRNWRSRDDDRDNIILQLEHPEIINSQWPPRISFT